MNKNDGYSDRYHDRALAFPIEELQRKRVPPPPPISKSEEKVEEKE